MSQNLKLLLAAVLLLCTVRTTAQSSPCTNQLTGQVMDDQTHQPITGAIIRIPSLSLQYQTDDKGYFRITGICKGRLRLQLQYLGYNDGQYAMVLRQDTFVTVYMHEAHQQLEGVSVITHKQALNTTTATNTVSGTALDKTRGGTLADAIQSIPGVRMLQTGATIAKPVINGMSGNRVLVLNNGIRQEGQQWGAEHAPEIDPFIAQQITVVKGAEAVRFGPEAIGGVVIVEPAALSYDSVLHGEVNAVGASNGRAGTLSAMLGSSIKKLPGLAWRIQGTAKQSGNLSTPDYYLTNTGVKELNYSASLGYAGKKMDIEGFYSHFNTSIGIFQGSHIGSIQDLMAHIANGRPFDNGNFSYAIDAPRQQIYHNLLKLKGHIHINDHLHLNAVYGFQHNRRQEFDLRRGGRTSIPSLDLSLATHTMDIFLDYYNDKGIRLTLGLNGLAQANTNTPGTFVTPLIPNYSMNGAGAYAILRYIKDRYELEAGLRYDYRHLDAQGYNSALKLYGGVHDYQNISGSGGAVWYIRRNLELRSNLGSAWRPPAVSELYSDGLHHGVAAIEIGDSTLKPEQSFKWINTLTYRTDNNRFHVVLNAYANYIYGYIYLSPSDSFQQSLRGAFPVFNYHQTDARFLGADLATDYHLLPQLTYAVKASVIRAKDIRNNQFLPWIPSDKLEHSLQWDLPAFAHFRNSYVQLAHVYVAHQNRYEPASDFAPPPPSYNLLNASAGTDWQLGRQKLGINLAVNNLTNTLYKDYMNRFRYYAHDLGRNVVLRLTYRF